jgi:hypothetical protein
LIIFTNILHFCIWILLFKNHPFKQLIYNYYLDISTLNNVILLLAIQKRQASGGVNFPDMGDYRREGSSESRRGFTYFVVGAAGTSRDNIYTLV